MPAIGRRTRWLCWVTRPVEEAVRATLGVLNVRSRTTRGSSQISIDFGWGRDMAAATLNVDSAVAAANVLQAVGKLEDHDKLYLVVSNQTLGTLDEIRNVVIRADTAGIVRLRDFATVQDGFVPQWIRVVEDGKPAVLFNVYERQ